MKQQPAYYANIPATVRYDQTLPANAKLLYGEITALCNKEGFCWASNQYFADLYGVANGTISDWVRKLVDAGHITYTITNRNTRQIFLKGVSGNPEGGYQEILKGVSGNPEHNNTVNNTKNNTTTSEHSSQGVSVGKIIKAFEAIDPKNKEYYRNVTQRRACDFLIEEYGLEEVLTRIVWLEQTNSAPYFPTITTPCQLKDKWVQLEKSLERHAVEAQTIKNKHKVAF